MEAILKRDIIISRSFCRIFCVVSFILLTSFGAFVRIPLAFSPVPITLQTLFVLLSGALLGSKFGFITQASYILLGMLGLPIFTGAGSGIAYFLGPTGGYLVGFVLVSFWIGRIVKKTSDNFLLNLAIFCLASLLILCFGVLWLKLLFGYSFSKLLLIGFIPFVPGDILKALIATVLYLRLKSRAQAIL